MEVHQLLCLKKRLRKVCLAHHYRKKKKNNKQCIKVEKHRKKDIERNLPVRKIKKVCKVACNFEAPDGS